MSLLRQKMIIALKGTMPTYILITLFTMIFLFPGRTMMSFSRFGEDLLAKLLFSFAFNLLYLIPQFMGLFLGLHFLKGKKSLKLDPVRARWFLRLPAPIAVVATAALIVAYLQMGFFPADVDLKDLYIIFIIIILMNLLFSLVLTINIYSTLTSKMRMLEARDADAAGRHKR